MHQVFLPVPSKPATISSLALLEEGKAGCGSRKSKSKINFMAEFPVLLSLKPWRVLSHYPGSETVGVVAALNRNLNCSKTCLLVPC